jgi:hypothetical protein
VAGISLLLLSGNATLAGQDRAGALTATGTGALRYVTGKIDGTQAFLIEEAATNLLLNPSAEVNTTNATALDGATVTRDTTYARSGVASFKIVTIPDSAGTTRRARVYWAEMQV